MIRFLIAAALCLWIAGAEAKPIFLRGGYSGGGIGNPGTPSACGEGVNVCAQHQNGQTFVTWNDLATGSEGNNWRYWVFRSTSPITTENYGSAQLIADYVFNNSAYLMSGDPEISSGEPFNQTNRQDPNGPMVPLSNLGPRLPYGTGLQVYTAINDESAYYAVVGKPCPNGVCTAGPDVYIGSVGPISETVSDPKPIKTHDSFSRATVLAGSNFGRMISPAGKPLALEAHASSVTGGAPGGNSRYGDYWVWFIPAADGYNWNDGAMTVLAVLQDTNGEIEVRVRDTLWNPLGTGGLQTFHNGIGMTPHSYIGPANRRYIGTANAYRRMLRWAIDHYSLDENKLRWTGQSMGAMGGFITGFRMTDPQFAVLFLRQGVSRMFTRSAASWPSEPSWGSNWPHRATLCADSVTTGCTTGSTSLGTVSQNVLLPDGSVWGGVGGYADAVSFVQEDPSQDLPILYFGANQDDSTLGGSDFQWNQQKDMANAMKAARRGYGFVWVMGVHDGNSGMEVFDCNFSTADTQICYPMDKLARNVAYPAFSNSSIDDDWGTTSRNEYGVIDGDFQGCINCGFKWTIVEDSASALSLTVDNVWMDRSPTPVRQTTLTRTIAASGGGTVTVADASSFQTGGHYYLVGGTEIINGTISGNTITFTTGTRGKLGTTARAHDSGETIQQFVKIPSGPNGGPYATMTVDVTPRRLQNFAKGRTNGQVITCDITPHGGSTTQQTPTVANGIFTLTGVTINASGVTSLVCN